MMWYALAASGGAIFIILLCIVVDIAALVALALASRQALRWFRRWLG